MACPCPGHGRIEGHSDPGRRACRIDAEPVVVGGGRDIAPFADRRHARLADCRDRHAAPQAHQELTGGTRSDPAVLAPVPFVAALPILAPLLGYSGSVICFTFVGLATSLVVVWANESGAKSPWFDDALSAENRLAQLRPAARRCAAIVLLTTISSEMLIGMSPGFGGLGPLMIQPELNGLNDGAMSAIILLVVLAFALDRASGWVRERMAKRGPVWAR